MALIFNRTFIGERTISRNSMLNAGPEDLSSQDAAEKKSCFETEFQVVSCYSLVNEKRSSNSNYTDLRVMNRTVVGPVMTPVQIAYDFRRSSGKFGRQLSSFCKAIRKFMQMFRYFGRL